MEFELSLVRQHAVEYVALATKVEAQNAELEKLRADVGELLGLKEKLAKCKELFKRLALADKWRSRISEHLDTTDQAADQALNLCKKVAEMLKTHIKLVVENEKLPS